MITVYKYDSDKRFSGIATVEDLYQKVPPGLLVAPPEYIPDNMDCIAQEDKWVLVEKVPQDSELARFSAYANILQQYNSRVQALASGYSQYERESWPVQTAEATAYTADPQAATPWLNAASTARGIDKTELAARVLAMDTAYRQIHGALTGHRQKLWDQIAAAQTAEDIAAIDVTVGWPA